MTNLRLSTITLVAANAVPLAGVLFWQWDIFSVIFLYWLESGVIGFYNIIKMAVIGKAQSFFLVPFFMIHYGGFMLVHLIFIIFFFHPQHGTALNPSSTAFDQALAKALWPISALFVSHGVSFLANFIGKKEYTAPTPLDQMNAPYKRIAIMHLTLVLGAFIMAAFDTLTVGLTLLIGLKTVADIYTHIREHAGTSNASP